MVKFLRTFNWEPVVFTAESPQYEYIDFSNFKDIPSNIEVIKRPIWEPYKLYKLMSGRSSNSHHNPMYARDKRRSLIDNMSVWIRGNIFIPDARFCWIRPSVRFLMKYLSNNPVDAVISNGPPHTNTVIGLLLSQKLKVPWLADFQDPWTQVDYYSMMKVARWADKRHKHLEQSVLREADRITIVSPTWAKDLESIGGHNVHTVYWGYDDDDFPSESPPMNDQFTIVHSGTLGFDRNPATLFRVFKELKEEIPQFSSDLNIKFAGVIDYTITDEIMKNNLQEHFTDLGTVSRIESIRHILGAAILLLPINRAENAKGRIPAKLFEYIRSRRPILCLGPSGSDAEQIITEMKAGIRVDYDNFHDTKKFVREQYQVFLEKKSKLPKVNLSKYSAVNQVSKIASLLDEIVK
jgi:glycosyltransferase involved in cell wall biosynthesis